MVLYHEGCNDGCMAAAVIAYYCELMGWPDPAFDSVNYGKPLPPQALRGGDYLLFVDFCPEREQYDLLCSRWGQCQVFDHHKSRKWIGDIPGNVWREDRSGAGIAWECTFQPALDNGWNFKVGVNVAHWLVLYVEDRDLWKFELGDTRDVTAYLNSVRDIARYRDPVRAVHGFAMMFKRSEQWLFNVAIRDGSNIRRGQEIARDSSAKYAFVGRLNLFGPMSAKRLPFSLGGAHWKTAVFCNSSSQASDLAHELLDKFQQAELAVIFWYVDPATVQLSFRSRPGTEHALEAASVFRGGGHAAAAGARISSSDFTFLLGSIVVDRQDQEEL
jgi:hypothetical protein